MASVFGIDLIRSTTELFRNARLRKKTSPWDGEQTGQSRVVRHMPNDDVGRLVEHEIIPRLLMVHQDDPRMAHFPADTHADMVTPAMHAQDGGDGFRDTSGTQSNDNQRPGAGNRGFASMAPLFDEAAIRAFADEVLAHEVNTLADIIIGHLDREVAPETLFIQLIAPTARELGEKWNRDECDFVDVTMGLWRLQLLLRTIAVWAPPPDGWALKTHRALFTTMPRDQHSLGTLMIGECFQRAGWDVETLIEPEQSEILLALGSSSFDVVGLTVTTDFIYRAGSQTAHGNEKRVLQSQTGNHDRRSGHWLRSRTCAQAGGGWDCSRCRRRARIGRRTGFCRGRAHRAFALKTAPGAA